MIKQIEISDYETLLDIVNRTRIAFFKRSLLYRTGKKYESGPGKPKKNYN